MSEIELNDRVLTLLAKVAKKNGFNNYTTHAEEGVAKGDNYLGIITKVKVTEVETNKIANYIIKSAPENPKFRKFMPMVEACKREKYFYSNVIEVYKNLLKEYKQEPLNIFTKVLASDMGIPELLIMPDIKEAGYVMHDRMKLFDLKHVKLVMETYGKFHGLYYALKTLKPEKCKELYDNMAESFFTSIDHKTNNLGVSKHNDKMRKCLKDADAFVLERFEVFCKDQMKRILEHMKPTAAGRFAVINHGDSWVNNMLFKYNKQYAQDPTDICLLDFQLARIGSPAMDLAYFIFTCTSKDLRDQHYSEIMQCYHDAMRDLLEGFSLKVEDFLTMEELDQQMRLFSLYGIYMTISVSRMMLSCSDKISEFHTLENKDGKDVNDTFKSLNYLSKNDDIYNERMRNVFIDCVNKGYL